MSLVRLRQQYALSLSLCLFVSLSLCLSLAVCASPFLCLSLSVSLCASLSHCACVCGVCVGCISVCFVSAHPQSIRNHIVLAPAGFVENAALSCFSCCPCLGVLSLSVSLSVSICCSLCLVHLSVPLPLSVCVTVCLGLISCVKGDCYVGMGCTARSMIMSAIDRQHRHPEEAKFIRQQLDHQISNHPGFYTALFLALIHLPLRDASRQARIIGTRSGSLSVCLYLCLCLFVSVSVSVSTHACVCRRAQRDSCVGDMGRPRRRGWLGNTNNTREEVPGCHTTNGACGGEGRTSFFHD